MAGKAKVSLSDSFAGLKKAQDGPTVAPSRDRVAKSRDTATYTTAKLFVRKDLKKLAARKWEDEHPETPDMADMFEHLLQQYLGA